MLSEDGEKVPVEGFPTDEDQRDRRTPSRRPMEFPVEDWYKDQNTRAKPWNVGSAVRCTVPRACHVLSVPYVGIFTSVYDCTRIVTVC